MGMGKREMEWDDWVVLAVLVLFIAFLVWRWFK